MLTYSFTNSGSDCLYAHLYKCIKNDITAGVLLPDSKLPSKRSFAKNLGISVITVENAYAQLQAEGYIYSLPKKGFYVCPIDSPKPKFSSPAENNARPAQPAEYFADFVSNRTNPDNFPFSTWAKLMRETITDRYTDLMKPSPCGGIGDLRLALCAYLRDFRSMKVEPEQIIVGAGTEYLYGLIIQLLGREKVYAVENPGYKKLAEIYKSSGVECRFIDMDGEGVKISSLEENRADVVHISPAHHFPTGIVTPIGRRYELLGWAAKSDSRYIIEDDFDSEFRMEGKPIPMLQSIDVSEKVIYMNTFSKSLSSTIRVSYMVLPPHLAERFYKNLGFYSCTVSTFEQYTLARFISEGYFEKHVNRMRNHYRGLRNALVQAVKDSTLSKKAVISEEDAGLHFLLKLDTPLPDAEIVRLAQQRGIRVSCLSEYCQGEKRGDSHTLIINYSGLAQDCVEELVRRINSII